METTSRKEALTVLRRLISYSEKIFSLSATLLAPLGDRRLDPRRSAPAVVKTALVLFWARLPSLNALARIYAPRFWKQWLGEPLASADTLGRVPAGLYADQLRQTIFLVYQQLKRNKALPDHQGIGLAVLDGHESHASYRRHCAGCLQRTLHSFLAYNLFHAFFALNLKAPARNDTSQVLCARLMTAEFLHEMASLNRSP